MNTSITHFVAYFLFLSTASAVGSAQTRLTDQAFFVRLNHAGVDMAAQVLEKEVLQDIVGMELPDSSDTASGGIKVELKDIKVWASFGAADATLNSTNLGVKIGIDRVRLSVGSLRAYKKVLGGTISTTCTDTEMILGEAGDLNLTTELVPSVVKNRVILTERSTAFSISDDNYRIVGPDKCSGALGIGNLIKSLLRNQLKKSKGTVEDRVKSEVVKAVPQLADRLNSELIRRESFELTTIPGVPPQRGEVHTAPYSLAISNRYLVVEMQVTVVKGEDASKEESQTEEPWLGDGTGIEVGRTGFNPEVLNEAFRVLFANGGTYVEVDGDAAPGLKDVLDINSAASIWPDLTEVEPNSNSLRLYMKVSEPPVVTLGQSSGSFDVSFPALDLLFKINLNNRWRNYFHMRISFSGNLATKVKNNQIVLTFQEQHRFDLSGHWDPSYTPEIEIFEQDVAEFLFTSIIDYLYAAGPLSKVDIPTLEVGSESLTLGAPYTQEPYMRFPLLK
jgi:hypothetical protein